MKCQIFISGQISGNHKLYNKLGADGLLNRKDGSFNAIHVEYATRAAAKKALSVAYQRLIADELGLKGHIGGIRYSRGFSLAYDASRAVISDN